ncbi:hypothetical protein AB0C93_12025 [Streptomyces sp. NPDC048518]|uniref:hypothetical protein n=1 Tax=Streptomyces sp. NPDC048518 TaxID=3155029 RepID=UPI0033EBE66D
MITKRFEDGKSLSCATQPTVMAMMLDQLAVREGTTSWKPGPEPATTPPSCAFSPDPAEAW